MCQQWAGPKLHSLLSAHHLGTYFLTTEDGKHMRLLTRLYGMTMKHYRAKASTHWIITCIGLNTTIELAGWYYTACSHEVRVWSQASMNWNLTIQDWSNHKNVHCTKLHHAARCHHICNFAIWTNHVLISWLTNQQKAIKPRTKDRQRNSL